jgi:V/A-type H+-transporting ATPase subunit E
MAHTVESFVETLRSDGVEAGRQEAEKIRLEAQQEAEQTVRNAEAKACQIVEDAEKQREMTLQRTRTDLELAARDTVARLRDVLSQAANRLLTQAASTTLDDSDFLKELIREVASAYARSDATGEQTIELNVPKPMEKKLADWAIASFRQAADQKKLPIELHGSLATAGFEYKIAGGTVEVTPESVVQVLSQIVTPQLQELIASIQEDQAAES